MPGSARTEAWALGSMARMMMLPWVTPRTFSLARTWTFGCLAYLCCNIVALSCLWTQAMIVSGTRLDILGAEPSLGVGWDSAGICDEDESIPSRMEEPRLPMEF